MLRQAIDFLSTHRRYVFFSTLVVMALAASPARSQTGGVDFDPGDPGTGGRNSIQGSVYYPSGRHLDKRMRVKLNTLRGGDLTTLTDDNGAFSFRRLAPGSYTVVIDGDKDYEPAIERVDITQPISRASAAGQIITVQIQLRLKQGGGAKPAILNAALAGVPTAAVELYRKALEFAQQGESKKAIEQLEKAISVYPQFMLALNELGVQHLRLGQLDKAVAAFRSALEIAPDVFEPRLNYGIALVYLKQLKDAEAELRLALVKNDSSAVAHYFLGRALAVQRKFDEAEKELERGISLGGSEVGGAHRYLGAIYKERGDNQRAISELETYLRLVPSAEDAAQIRKIIAELKVEAQTSQKTKSKG